jgi:hypothetical protein
MGLQIIKRDTMRGFLYMIEAIIAGVILIGFLLFIGSGYPAAQSYDPGTMGYSILHDLDRQGILRDYVAENNASGLDSRISLFGYGHSVLICGQSGACQGTVPDAGDVWVGNYLVSGKDDYQPRLVKIYMWRL